jgi:hypothetical protein
MGVGCRSLYLVLSTKYSPLPLTEPDLQNAGRPRIRDPGPPCVSRDQRYFFVDVVVVVGARMLSLLSPSQYSEPSARVAMWYPERQVMPMSLDERSAGDSFCGAVEESLQAASVTAAVAASSRRIRIGYLGGLGQRLRRETATGIGSGVKRHVPLPDLCQSTPVTIARGGRTHPCHCHASTCVFASMLSS